MDRVLRLIGALSVLLALMGCNNTKVNELGDTLGVVRHDVSPPIPSDAIDILWVIDDSGSMREEQVALAENFDSFIEELDELGADFRIGVTTTWAGGRGELQTEPWSLDPDSRPPELDYCLELDFDQPFLERSRYVLEESGELDLDRLREEFRCIASVGINPQPTAGFEAGLDAMMMALRGDSQGANEPFVREGALLGVIFLSDEDDCSSGGTFSPDANEECYLLDTRSNLTPVSTYVNFLEELKGGADQVLVAGLIGPDDRVAYPASRAEFIEIFDRSLPIACLSQLGTDSESQAIARDGERYRELIEAFGDRGVVDSVCTADFASSLAEIGNVVSGNLSTICLDAYPETCSDDSDCSDGVACQPQGSFGLCGDFEIVLEVSDGLDNPQFETLVSPGPVGESEPAAGAQYTVNYNSQDCPTSIAFTFQNGGRPASGGRYRVSYPTDIEP